jgi:hypothetical protein
MDPATIGLIIGLATLAVERMFAFARKIKKSKCWGIDIQMKETPLAVPKREKSEVGK